MIKRTLLICLVLTMSVSTLLSFNDRSFYGSYTYSSFSRSSVANRSINFNNINYKLLGAAIFYATNEIRSKFRLSRFKYSRVLFKAAFMHSKDMVRYKFMGHYSPVASKRTPSKRVRMFGRWNRTVGENVASTFGIQYKPGQSFFPPRRPGGVFRNSRTRRPIPPHTYMSFARFVLSRWMQSPGHRRNILNPRFKVLGAAAYYFAEGRYRFPKFKATQVFAGGTNDEMNVGRGGRQPQTENIPRNVPDSPARVIPPRGGLDKDEAPSQGQSYRPSQPQRTEAPRVRNIYSRYNYSSFRRSSLANRSIKFNNINYKLLGAAIFYATNEIRSKFRLSRFKYSNVLFKAAFMHSKDMVRYKFMGHYSPVASKRTPSKRVRMFGRWKRTVGENVASTFGIQYRPGQSFFPPRRPGGVFRNSRTRRPIPPHTYMSFARFVLSRWMKSPGHRRNILNPRFKVLGAAAYYFAEGRYRFPKFKATQVFAGGTNDEINVGR